MTYRSKQATRLLKAVLCACVGFSVLMSKTTLINAQEGTQAERDLKYYSELTPERALVMFKAYLYSFEGMTEERVNQYINQVKKLPVDQQAAKIVALKKPFEERRIRETRLKAIEEFTEEIRGKFFYIPEGVKENYIDLIQSAPLEAFDAYREELLALDKKNSLMADVYLKLREELFKMKFLTQSDKNHYDDEMESAYNDKNEYMMQSVFKRAQEANEKARLKAPETKIEQAKEQAKIQINRLYVMVKAIDSELNPLPNNQFNQKYKLLWDRYDTMHVPKEVMIRELENQNTVEDVERYQSRKIMTHFDYVLLEYSARKAQSLAERYPNVSSIQNILAEDIFKAWPKGDVSGLAFVADKRLQRLELAIEAHEAKQQPQKPVVPEKPQARPNKNKWEGTVGKSSYFDGTGNRLKNTWKRIDQKNYYFNHDGLPMTGFFTVNQKRFYATPDKGIMTGWYKVGQTWYYSENDGSVVTGWKKINNKWYYLETSGAMAKGWRKVSNKWYYLEDSGAMAVGWKKVSNKWYYLETSGNMATGWKKINNKWYYLEDSGAMTVGWKKINNRWYYLEPSGMMATGWKKINNKWYFLNDSGAMITGRHKIHGTWYRFNQNGAMI